MLAQTRIRDFHSGDMCLRLTAVATACLLFTVMCSVIGKPKRQKGAQRRRPRIAPHSRLNINGTISAYLKATHLYPFDLIDISGCHT